MNQEQLSQSHVRNPYKNPETSTQYGSKGPLDSQRNRENQNSRDHDNRQNLKIGIRDIDEAVLYYFKEVIRPTVVVDSSSVEVPVVYATPERWKAVQEDGFYRDKNGKRQVPVIIFKRDSLTKVRNITTKLDANRPNNIYILSQRPITQRNRYSRFNQIQSRIPEREYVITVVPDYVKLEYSCKILTDYVDQMNGLVEAIEFASDSYWGDREKFQFQSFIDTFKTDITANNGEDRLVTTDFTLKLNGYIIPEQVNTGPYVNGLVRNKTNMRVTFGEGIC